MCAFTLRSFPRNNNSRSTARAFTYDEISEVKTEGKHLLLNGNRFIKCDSEKQSEFFKIFIKKLLSEQTQNREKRICEFFATQFSKNEALTQLTLLNRVLIVLKWVSSILFVLIFFITPIAVYLYGLNHTIIPVAIIIFATDLFISAYYWHIHRIYYPSHYLERISNTIKMILCPPSCIRSVDLMAFSGMSRYHPLLLAHLLLPPDNFFAFAHTVIRDLNYPIRHETTDSRALAIASWHRMTELDACIKLLNKEYSMASDVFLAPPSWDGASFAYCPRCLCQFATQSRECPDCPGVELIPFTQISSLEKTHE
jgi:hypothetical protein